MNLTDKKRYFKPRLIVVPIDQEITLVMFTRVNPGDDFAPAAPTNQSSEVFGNTTDVGANTINWQKK